MKSKHTKIFTVVFALAIAGGTLGLVQASNSKEGRELQLFSQAKISLQDAIRAAEKGNRGKAIAAEIDDESVSVQFEVEIVKEGKIHEVTVDGKTGQVVKVSLEDDAEEGIGNERD